MAKSRRVFNLDDQTLAQLKARAAAAGLSEEKGKSKYLAALIGGNDLTYFTPDQLATLQNNFADLARVGGLLNQLTHHLNEGWLQHLDGQAGGIDPRLDDLGQVVTATHAIVKDIKRQVEALASTRGI